MANPDCTMCEGEGWVWDEEDGGSYDCVCLRTADEQTLAAGFHGYEGCPLLDPRSEGSCPTPFICSERGDCGAVR